MDINEQAIMEAPTAADLGITVKDVDLWAAGGEGLDVHSCLRIQDYITENFDFFMSGEVCSLLAGILKRLILDPSENLLARHKMLARMHRGMAEISEREIWRIERQRSAKKA